MSLSLSLNAQFVVKGKVTDKSNNEPLPGVTVSLQGSSSGTSTSSTGTYSITLPNGNGALVFSNVGYSNQTIKVNGKQSIDVQLAAGLTPSLSEVVVVGYGTQRKKDLTGAVGQVKATQLENENPSSVQDVLRGNVSGLNISQTNSASAKGGGDLLVRGKSSINAGTSPLIVVDGVIYYG